MLSLALILKARTFVKYPYSEIYELLPEPAIFWTVSTMLVAKHIILQLWKLHSEPKIENLDEDLSIWNHVLLRDESEKPNAIGSLY